MIVQVGAGVTRSRWNTPFSRSRATVSAYPTSAVESNE